MGNEAKKINLAKLKAWERPHAEKEITLCGEKQTVTVYCLHDTTALKLNNITGAESQMKAMLLILQDGLNITADEAQLIMDNDLNTGVEIVGTIRDLTAEYMKKREEERKIAEKNLNAEQAANTVQ